VVRYSVLHGNEQLFASKYKLVLPSEEELRAELEREQRLLENSSESGKATKSTHAGKKLIRESTTLEMKTPQKSSFDAPERK
jgi:hypothetical protein